jgi:hypothetical protein
VKDRTPEQQPSTVPETAQQGGDIRARWAWVEPTVWTERMLAALETGMPFGSANLGEDLKRLQVDVVSGVPPAGIEVGSDYLVDAGSGFALDFELGRELRCEVLVEQLLAAIDLDAK